MSSAPVQRQETSHLDDPVSPVSGEHPHTATGARGDDTVGTRDHTAASESSDNVQDAKERPAQQTRMQSIGAHFKRFWWVYLIVGVIFAAILFPLLFTVIMPAIVQDVVNKQKLPVTGGSLVALGPNSLNMSLTTSLDTPLKATVHKTPLALFNRATEPFKPFLHVDLPTTTANQWTEVSVANQTLEVEDMDELIKWFHKIFDDPEVEVGVKGKPTVQLTTLKYHPQINQNVKVGALNYLKGFGIKDLEFTLPAKKDTGYNLKGVLNLPNSGTLTLALGNLTFNMMMGDLNLGFANIYDTNLAPGMNHPPFDGELFFDQLIPNVGKILEIQKDSLAKGVISFNATGNSSTVDGKHLSYVEKVLNTKHIPFDIPVVTLLSDLANGVLGDTGAIKDIAGNITGDNKLMDEIMSHWNDTSSKSKNDDAASKKLKRVVPNASLVWNMLRLGNRVKKHEL